jgi:hypothetical protein
MKRLLFDILSPVSLLLCVVAMVLLLLDGMNDTAPFFDSNRLGWLVSCSSVVLLTAILPALWLRSWQHSHLRRWRMAHGFCPVCGYDLRASKDRCPECGTPMPAPEAKA